MSMVTELEEQIDSVKTFRKQADRVLRLSKNRDFRELVLDGFCRDEMARLAHVSGDPGISFDDQKKASDMSRAGGHLKRFLNTILQHADAAERDLPAMEEQLNMVRSTEEAREEGFYSMGGEPLEDLSDDEGGE